MQGKKSQIVITDFVVSAFIFFLLIILIFFLWSFYNIRLEDDLVFEDMQIKIFQISNILVKTGGNPSDWEKNVSKATMIGLAEEDRILSEDKVANFTRMNQSNVSSLLKLGRYNFSMNLTDLQGNTLASFGKYTYGEKVVGIRRYVLYNGKKSIMAFRIWE